MTEINVETDEKHVLSVSKSVSKLFHVCFTELSYHSNSIILIKKKWRKIKNENFENSWSNIGLSTRYCGCNSSISFSLWEWGIQTPYSPQAAVGGTGNVPQVSTPQVLAPITQTNTQTPTLYTPSYTNPQQYGGWGGCWGRGGWGIGAGYPTTGTTATPLTITQAAEIAKTYVASLNNPDLTVKQIEEYTNNFYVPVTQVSTGNGAFELLINKATGIVTPEPGPNMMWNTQYTFGAGFCNWAQRHNHSSTNRNS